MSEKAILCYIYSWSHGSLHVYSLVGGLVPGRSWGSGWLILLFFDGVANHFSSFSPLSNSSTGDPIGDWLAARFRLCTCQVLAETLRRQDSCIRLLSACTSCHPQYRLHLVTVYGMDPQVGQSLDGLSFSLCSILCVRICFHEYFVSLLRTKALTLWSSFFLKVCKLYLGYPELLG